MRRMADAAALTHGLVLIHKWTALLRVTLEAGFVSAQEREAARFKRLLNICWSTFGRDPFVRFMTIAAAHLAFRHRMMMGQGERCANVQVTLETGVRRFSWINDRASSATGLNVQTSGTMAGLATHVLRVFTFCLQ